MKICLVHKSCLFSGRLTFRPAVLTDVFCSNCRDSTSNQATTASFCVFSGSLFTSDGTSWCCVVWAIGSGVKYVINEWYRTKTTNVSESGMKNLGNTRVNKQSRAEQSRAVQTKTNVICCVHCSMWFVLFLSNSQFLFIVPLNPVI
jgi:hypothetical protein